VAYLEGEKLQDLQRTVQQSRENLEHEIQENIQETINSSSWKEEDWKPSGEEINIFTNWHLSPLLTITNPKQNGQLKILGARRPGNLLLRDS
jgi:hypothetical protein